MFVRDIRAVQGYGKSYPIRTCPLRGELKAQHRKETNATVRVEFANFPYTSFAGLDLTEVAHKWPAMDGTLARAGRTSLNSK